MERITVDVPGVTLTQRGTVNRLPSTLHLDNSLQSSEYIFRLETKHGNYTKMLRERLKINLKNPYKDIKNECLSRGILTDINDPVLKQFRSTLKTDWLITDTLGWNDLNQKIITLDAALSYRNWWQDEGYPLPFTGNTDHTLVKGQIYRLKKREWIVCV